MTLTVDDRERVLPLIERAVDAIGYQLTRDDAAAPAETLAMVPGYRRALWTVVILNAGYGVIELGGGVLADSQALRADALDFLGDGVITMMGILALGWSLVWRARSALLQGVFLGVLGIGVLGTAIVNAVAGYEPEAGLMSVYGIVALAVNVASALVLIPHRTGDANVRAVWLFSRNDAIGNVAVVIAAGFVALTGSGWPDLLVAVVMASLFLHASWVIVRDARKELAG